MNLNLTAFTRNQFTEIIGGAYVINLDEYKSTGTHWIALYVNDGKCNIL